MRTVKEMSVLTGISVRTLHYYDEIGLLKPTVKSEAGYRLYDDKALEELQQILFFREFDIPLKEIKAIMKHPALDQKQILQMQRHMLVAKKERMERLIASIDHILKGENQMDFEVFSKTELEDIADSMIANMKEEQKAIFAEQHGSLAAWREQFLANAASESAQKNFQKVVGWYGSKEKALEASKNPANTDLLPVCQQQIQSLLIELAAKREADVASQEIMELIAQYDLVSRQMFQMDDLTSMMLDMAAAYQNKPELKNAHDSIYGEGFSVFFGKALEAFYRH